MRMKYLLSLSLGAALLCCCGLLAGCVGAGAEGSGADAASQSTAQTAALQVQPKEEKPEYTIARHQEEKLVRVWGTARLLENGQIRISGGDPGADEVLLNLTDATAVLRATDGAPLTRQNIRDGETVYAYVEADIAQGLPAAANAALILADIPTDFSVPAFSEVEQISAGGDRAWALMSDDVVLSLKDAELLPGPGMTCGTLTPADITPGMFLLAWYDVVQESFPAQAGPSKVMLFRSRYEGWAVLKPGHLSVNGVEAKLAGRELPYVKNGALMVPLRVFAQALDCRVTWYAPYPDLVEVDRGCANLYTIDIHLGTALTSDGESAALSVPPEVKNGVTFLAADDLLALHNVKAEGPWPV